MEKYLLTKVYTLLYILDLKIKLKMLKYVLQIADFFLFINELLILKTNKCIIVKTDKLLMLCLIYNLISNNKSGYSGFLHKKSWNIVKSGIKEHNPNTIMNWVSYFITTLTLYIFSNKKNLTELNYLSILELQFTSKKNPKPQEAIMAVIVW